MEEQATLDLGQPPRPAMLYFALRPDIAAAREMMEVGNRCRKRHRLSALPFGMDRLHVSLAPAVSRRGFRKDDVSAAFRAAARVSVDPFAVSFSRLCTFGGGDKRPVVLCSNEGAALIALRNTLRNELAKAGLWHGRAQFQPHVTLFWDRFRIPEEELDNPIRWTVEDFVLVRSLIGHGRHVDLARWPLRGRWGGMMG